MFRFDLEKLLATVTISVGFATISFKHIDVKKDFIATKAGKPIALVKYISDKNEYKPRII